VTETPYTYTGANVAQYMQYADYATGKMLIAAPGGSYAMYAVQEGPLGTDGQPTQLAIPPGDGNWVLSSSTDDDTDTPLALPAAPAYDAEGGDSE
jgi:hypothetical protein